MSYLSAGEFYINSPMTWTDSHVYSRYIREVKFGKNSNKWWFREVSFERGLHGRFILVSPWVPCGFVAYLKPKKVYETLCSFQRYSRL